MSHVYNEPSLASRTSIGLLRDWHYWNTLVGFATLHDIHHKEGAKNRDRIEVEMRRRKLEIPDGRLRSHRERMRQRQLAITRERKRIKRPPPRSHPSRRSFLTGLAASVAPVPVGQTSVNLLSNVFAFVPPVEAAISAQTTVANITHYGAKALGRSAPASNYYTSLAALRADYPMATALTNEMDWLAFQKASTMVSDTGGVIFCPAGSYVFCNIHSPTDGSGQLGPLKAVGYPGIGSVSVLGEFGATIFQWPVDLGKSRPVTTGNPYGYAGAIICGDYTDPYGASAGYFQDLIFIGPGAGPTLGSSACQMVGIMTNDRRALTRTTAFGFYAGVYVIGGQTRWSECYFEKNYYGAYWARHTIEFGDMVFDRVDFSLNNRAGIGCAPGDNGPVTSLFNKCIFDAEPYGIFKESQGYTSMNNGNVLYDNEFYECQFENIGNAMIGDGLSVGGNFTGSISGATLHVTAISSGVMLSPGQVIAAGIGAPIAIAAGTYIVQQISGKSGGVGNYAISVPQTVVREAQVASRASFIYNTKISGSQFMWGATWRITAEPQLGIIQCGGTIGLYIEHPIITFGWTPGVDCLFEIGQIVGSQPGSYTPQQGFRISGDVSTLLQNCITAGKGFFGSASYITPSAAMLDNNRFWQGETTFAAGYQNTIVGSVVLANSSGVTLCAGTPSDNVQGVLILAAVWGVVAYQGDVNVACGTNGIAGGQYVRTAAGGIVTSASGANDTTSKVIGYALKASSSGLVAVRLQGIK